MNEIEYRIQIEEDERAEQSDEMLLEAAFQGLRSEAGLQVKSLVSNKGMRLNSKGRMVFIFPMLDRLGIDTFEKLEAELDLIMEEKSQLGSNVRTSIMQVFTVCMDIMMAYNEGRKESLTKIQVE